MIYIFKLGGVEYTNKNWTKNKYTHKSVLYINRVVDANKDRELCGNPFCV